MDRYLAALERLNNLLTEAHARGAAAAETAALATADTAARPSVRMVTVMAVDREGVLFFANLKSGKGRQLIENPRASLCFYWPEMQEQVIIEGSAEVQSDEVSDHYWHRRGRDVQLVAWASDQSAAVDQKGAIREQARQLKAEFDSERIARNENWRAFRILPDRIEFWPTGWRRMRERVRYSLNKDGEWGEEMLAP